MRLTLEISRTPREKGAIAPISSTLWGWARSGIVREPFAGAWQRNIVRDTQGLMTHSVLYGCVTLIQSDIGKLRTKLVEQGAGGIWTEIENPAYSPVLRKPNRYQTHIDFKEQWVGSKLIHGNTYVLKERDARGVVVALYILDPLRVRPLVAEDGSVYYQLGQDNLGGVETNGVTVPASEIIHDKYKPLYHPLCGISPITACALAAGHGLTMQEHSSKLFANGAQPGGILTAPGFINTETADRLKREWEERYGGNNVGRVAVLGDGLKYEGMSVNPVDAQLIEQMKFTSEQICSAFHIPGFLVGVGGIPANANVESLWQIYYSQCLQNLIEMFETLLDEGLGLAKNLGTELDLDGLLRMDTATKVKAAADAIGAGFMAPNEARRKFDLPPVKGGDTPYLQQQNYSLAALDERDRNKPFDKPPAVTPPDEPVEDDDEDDEGEPMDERVILGLLSKGADVHAST